MAYFASNLGAIYLPARGDPGELILIGKPTKVPSDDGEALKLLENRSCVDPYLRRGGRNSQRTRFPDGLPKAIVVWVQTDVRALSKRKGLRSSELDRIDANKGSNFL
jgi:hypothetical protein